MRPIDAGGSGPNEPVNSARWNSVTERALVPRSGASLRRGEDEPGALSPS